MHCGTRICRIALRVCCLNHPSMSQQSTNAARDPQPKVECGENQHSSKRDAKTPVPNSERGTGRGGHYQQQRRIRSSARDPDAALNVAY